MEEKYTKMHSLSFSKYIQECSKLDASNTGLDLRNLIVNCLHLSLSKMSDQEENCSRILLRVQILLNLFEEPYKQKRGTKNS